MPPALTMLDQPTPLAEQVAAHLLRGMSERPWDISGVQVWIPTSGAGSRIRCALARRAAEAGTGVISPRFVQPMAATLPEGLVLASRAEREGAWATAVTQARRSDIDAVFPHAIDSDFWLMEVGGMLCDMCDLLGEAALSPLDPEVAAACAGDEERWNQIPTLYKHYLRVLESCGLQDPNAARAQHIRSAKPSSATAVVIACVSDLPVAAARYAEAMMAAGVPVDVLVWKPEGVPCAFDPWGRPLPAEWTDCDLPVAASQIVMANDAESQAAKAVRYLSESQSPGDYTLVLADPELAPAFRSEVLRAGGNPFVPGGEDLSASEPATVASSWIEWTASHRLHTLRRLLECPHFAKWLGTHAGIPISKLLETCNALTSGVLAESMDQVLGWLKHSTLGEGRQPKEDDADFIKEVQALADTLDHCESLSPDEVVRQAWGGAAEGTAAQVLDLYEQLKNSPVYTKWPEGLRLAFSRTLKGARTFAASMPGDVELTGWLEAPWSGAARLAVCGCAEGRLPASVDGHVFLPDSRRAPLGIADNTSRRARDSYLLACLLAGRPSDDFRCFFSRYGADGSPALPSNLLLRCAEQELPARVSAVFGQSDPAPPRPRRENGWRWHLPSDQRRSVAKLSPTDFKEYLACPFRYYFKRVLHLEESDPLAREMDALRFGTLMHKAIELFSKSTPLERDARKIESQVIAHLESQAEMAFGPLPTPAVRVQLESAKSRLRAFASVQAETAAEGWTILEAEWKLRADADRRLSIGPLPLSAQIDRIEEHPDGRLRIIDYKTYASSKPPEKTHLGPSSASAFLDEAQVEVGGRRKSWLDLQLPLYRHIAEHFYPGRTIQVAYFILAADPDETAILEFDLTDDLQASAMRCATAIAERVARGCFWPPQPQRGGWDDPYADLFLNGSPEKCLDAETITYLEGRL